MMGELHKRVENAGESLNVAAIWVVRIAGSAIFVVLLWYAMRYTQYILPSAEELPVNEHDSMAANIVFGGAALLVVFWAFLVERKLSGRMCWMISHVALMISMLWVGGWSLWWIQAADRKPVGDQAFIYGTASYFLEGNYNHLAPGAYCDRNPHQLGLIALLELLFLAVGTYNYFAVQVICACMAAGIVYFGYRITWEITASMTAAAAYCVMMMGCFPLVFYTGWVYGDVPSILFALMLAHCLIRYVKTGRAKWLAGMVGSSVMAMLVRKNSLILLVALCLVAGVLLMRNWDKKLFLAVILSLLLPYITYQGIYKMYELRSGYEHSDGMPAMSYIAMGMQEIYGRYGWYTIYCSEVYDSQQNDTRLAAQVSWQDVKGRLREFKNDPSYALRFYREKVLAQWNAPLYQSMYFSNQFWEGDEPEPGSFLSQIYGRFFFKILWFCDRLQFIVYGGLLCYYLFAVRKGSSLSEHLLAVTVIGGFLFSILWEAKARYILPYYVAAFPLAATGYYQVVRQAVSFMAGRLGRQKGRTLEEEKREDAA